MFATNRASSSSRVCLSCSCKVQIGFDGWWPASHGRLFFGQRKVLSCRRVVNKRAVSSRHQYYFVAVQNSHGTHCKWDVKLALIISNIFA